MLYVEDDPGWVWRGEIVSVGLQEMKIGVVVVDFVSVKYLWDGETWRLGIGSNAVPMGYGVQFQHAQWMRVDVTYNWEA